MPPRKDLTEQKKRELAHDSFHFPSAAIALPASQVKVSTSLQYSLWGAVLLGQEGLDQESLIEAILKDPYGGPHHMANIPIKLIDLVYHEKFIQYVTRDIFKSKPSDASPAYNSNKYLTLLSKWNRSLQDDIRKNISTHKKIEDIIKENAIVAEIRAAIELSLDKPEAKQDSGFDTKEKPDQALPISSRPKLDKAQTLQDRYIHILTLQIETGGEAEALKLLKAIVIEKPVEKKDKSKITKTTNPDNDIIIEANLHLANKYNDLSDQAKAKNLSKSEINKLYEEANQCLERAMAMGSAEAAFCLAKNYYEGRTKETGAGIKDKMISILDKLAKDNHAPAINLLSIIRPENNKAETDKLSKSDSPESQYNLGKIYEKLGISDKAFNCYLQSAQQGFALAQNYLSSYYLSGKVVKADPKVAFEWFGIAAAQGLNIAQDNLACCYSHGIGTNINLKMAFRFYLKAITQGFYGSCKTLISISISQAFTNTEPLQKQKSSIALAYMLSNFVPAAEKAQLVGSVTKILKRMNTDEFVTDLVAAMDNYIRISHKILKQLMSSNCEDIITSSQSLISDVSKILTIIKTYKRSILNPLIIQNFIDISKILSPILNQDKGNEVLNELESILLKEDLENHLANCRDESGKLQRMLSGLSIDSLTKSQTAAAIKTKLTTLLAEINTKQFRKEWLQDTQILQNLKLISEKLSPIKNDNLLNHLAFDDLLDQLALMAYGKLPSSSKKPASETKGDQKKDEDDWSALMTTVNQKHPKAAKALLAKSSINLNQQDRHGQTALMFAAYRGHAEIAHDMLAQKNIDVNLQDESGNTALVNAAALGHLGIVRDLLAQKNINPNLQDKDGHTALMIAAGRKHVGIVQDLLAQKNIDVNLRDEYGLTALMIATDPIIKDLLQTKIKENQNRPRRTEPKKPSKDSAKPAPIITAANQEPDPIVKALLGGIDQNLTGQKGRAALITANDQERKTIKDLLARQDTVRDNGGKKEGEEGRAATAKPTPATGVKKSNVGPVGSDRDGSR